jgi:hypothetical protein
VGALLLVAGVVSLNFLKTRQIVEVPRERLTRSGPRPIPDPGQSA